VTRTGSIHTEFYVIEKSIIESARALLVDPLDRVLLIELALRRIALEPTALRQTSGPLGLDVAQAHRARWTTG